MARRSLPPAFQPGPLTRGAAQALNDLAREVCRLAGFTAAPPLRLADDAAGLHLAADLSSLPGDTTFTGDTTFLGDVTLPTTTSTSPVVGGIFLNLATGLVEYYFGGAYVSLTTGATPGSDIRAVGTANAAGVSALYAREDHVHQGDVAPPGAGQEFVVWWAPDDGTPAWEACPQLECLELGWPGVGDLTDTPGQLILHDDAGGYVILQPKSGTADYVFRLPPTSATPGYVLTADTVASGSVSVPGRDTGPGGTGGTVTVPLVATKWTNPATLPAATPAGVPQWVKVTKTFADFATAATTNTITVYTLPAGGIVHNTKVKHTAAFGGGAIGSYTLNGVGVTGATTKYGPFLKPLGGAPASTDGSVHYPSGQITAENQAATTAVTATVTSTGANLNAATAGSLDVYLLVSVAV